MRDFLSVFTDSAKEFTKVRSLVTTSLLVAVSMVLFKNDIIIPSFHNFQTG